MITGAHTLIFSKDAEADRIFFRDVLRLSHVDVGDGWLIFGLPPSEVAIHPTDECDRQAFYLICDDIEGFILEMEGHAIHCTPIQDQSWGRLTHLTLPGGGTLGVYQASHAHPGSMPGE